MTPVSSKTTSALVTDGDRDSLQYRLRTDPANPVASSSDVMITDGSGNVNIASQKTGNTITPTVATVSPTPRPSRRTTRSPAEIAKKLADDLKIGYSVGTRKIRKQLANMAGFYERHAHQIAIRSKQAGSYVTTMHEAFHGLSERIEMGGL